MSYVSEVERGWEGGICFSPYLEFTVNKKGKLCYLGDKNKK
jgi:hypothetical protein